MKSGDALAVLLCVAGKATLVISGILKSKFLVF